MGNRENLAILSALAVNPEYPRRLAARLHRQETHVARRLRLLEHAGLVQGGWAREAGKNVRLYSLKTRRFGIVLGPDGYRVQAHRSMSRAPPPGLEGLPSRRPFFGRDRELTRLADPRYRFDIVVGLAGMGKTSLAAEFAHRKLHGRVVWHSFTPLDTAQGLIKMAARWATPIDDGLTRMLERPGWDLASALDRTTRRLSRRTLLIVLDDYQKVQDAAIHEIIRHWQRNLIRPQLIVSSRTRPPFDLDARTQLLHLAGLRSEDARSLLRSRGLDIPPESLGRLRAAYGGHPLALVLAAEQSPDGGGQVKRVLEELGRRAVETLDERSRKVLIALAVVRRPVGLGALQYLTGIPDPSLSLILLDRRALVRTVGQTYEVHDVIREALTPLSESSVALHRMAASMYRSSKSAVDVVEALYHGVRAGDFDVVANLLEKLVVPGGVDPVESGLGTFLDVLEAIPIERLRPRHRALVHLGRANTLFLLQRISEAIEAYAVARREAESGEEVAILGEVLWSLAMTLAHTEQVVQAERAYRRYLRLVETQGWADRRAQAFFGLMIAYQRMGEMKQSKEFCDLAIREARRTGRRDVELDIKANWQVSWPEDWTRVVPFLRRQGARLRTAGQSSAMTDLWLGEIAARSTWERNGGPQKAHVAIAHLDRALRGFELRGAFRAAQYCRTWRAFALLLAGRTDEAEAEATDVLASEQRVFARQRPWGRFHVAILAHRVIAYARKSRGDWTGARKATDAAIRAAERFHCGCKGIALLERAQIQEALGNRQSARRLIKEAVVETARGGTPDEVRYARREAQRRGLVG